MQSFLTILNTPRNELSVQPLGDRLVNWTDKRGNYKSLTTEGAIFKGGQALQALRGTAAEVALVKALKGRYTSAADIIGAKFPAVLKAAEKLEPRGPGANKSIFLSFLNAVLREQPKDAAKGWNPQQALARELAQVLVENITEPAEQPETIENSPTVQ